MDSASTSAGQIKVIGVFLLLVGIAYFLPDFRGQGAKISNSDCLLQIVMFLFPATNFVPKEWVK